MQAYCLKCRAMRNLEAAQQVTLKNGKTAMQAPCPVCGTRMSKLVKTPV